MFNKNTYRMTGMSVIVSLLLMVPALCSANLTVSPMLVALNMQQTGGITITSKSTDAQFIQGNVTEVHNPGATNEHETPVAIGQQNGLVITPLKFTLSAGSSHQVRVITLGDNPEEKIYRAYFKSMTPDNVHSEDARVNFSSDVGVTILWGVVVMVPPAHPIEKLTYDASTQRIINSGNIHLKVRRIGLCSGGTNCQWTEVNKNVWPSRPYHLAIPALSQFKQGKVSIDYYNDYTKKTETVETTIG